MSANALLLYIIYVCAAALYPAPSGREAQAHLLTHAFSYLVLSSILLPALVLTTAFALLQVRSAGMVGTLDGFWLCDGVVVVLLLLVVVVVVGGGGVGGGGVGGVVVLVVVVWWCWWWWWWWRRYWWWWRSWRRCVCVCLFVCLCVRGRGAVFTMMVVAVMVVVVRRWLQRRGVCDP